VLLAAVTLPRLSRHVLAERSTRCPPRLDCAASGDDLIEFVSFELERDLEWAITAATAAR